VPHREVVDIDAHVFEGESLLSHVSL